MKKINYEYAVFQKAIIKRTYDKKDLFPKFPFSFIRFSEPRQDYLINNGATNVMQSFENNIKVLHTGLIPIYEGFMYGNNINEKGKLDFIIIEYDGINEEVHFWLFKNRKPKNKTKFTEKFIYQLRVNN